MFRKPNFLTKWTRAMFAAAVVAGTLFFAGASDAEAGIRRRVVYVPVTQPVTVVQYGVVARPRLILPPYGLYRFATPVIVVGP